MKKMLTLVVLTGLMLTGCGGKQEATEPAADTTALAVTVEAVTVPGVVGQALDKATDQLEDLGFKVEAKDIVDGKTIVTKENWQVVSQDPADGAQAAKGSTVKLGVKSLEEIAAEKIAAEKVAAEKAAAEKAAAEKAAAEKAAADAAAAKLAADQAAAQKAAAEQAAAQQASAQQAAKPAPVAPAPAAPAPVSVYYANCTAAKAAGAAPLYAGQAGYSTALDRDRDGVACEK